MRLFGPLRYTQCLSSERKHQFFKGNKHRNFKNLTKTCSKRHQVWQCCVDYNADGKLSRSVLKNDTHLHYVSPLSDELRANIDAWNLPPETTHTAKTCKINGICYSIGTVLCTSSQYLTHTPQLAQIVYIFIIGDNTVFGIRFLKIVDYDEYLRAFKVQRRERFGTMAATDLNLMSSSFNTTNGGSAICFDEHTNSLNSSTTDTVEQKPTLALTSSITALRNETMTPVKTKSIIEAGSGRKEHKESPVRVPSTCYLPIYTAAVEKALQDGDLEKAVAHNFFCQTRDVFMERYPNSKSMIDYQNISLSIIRQYPNLSKKEGFKLTDISTRLAKSCKNKRVDLKRKRGFLPKRNSQSQKKQAFVQKQTIDVDHDELTDSDNENSASVAKRVRADARTSTPITERKIFHEVSSIENRNTTPNSSPLPRSPIHESLPHLYLPDVKPHPDLYHDADAITVATQITIDSDETRTTTINETEAPDTTNENNLNTSKTVVDLSSMLAQSETSSSSPPFLPEPHA
ncbi:unnamed protein product, partial [Didymodactylos carnosus]